MTTALVQVELPEFADVDRWLEFLDRLGRAANKVGVRALVLSGYPPPVDQRVAWTTVTPDPGVLEINMALSFRRGLLCGTTTSALSRERGGVVSLSTLL